MKIWGFCQLAIGITLVILGSTVFRDRSWDHFAWKPNIAMFIPGMFLAFMSTPILLSGFSPQIMKFGSKLQSETMDYAGEDYGKAISKTANVVVSSVTPAIKTAFTAINEVTNTSNKKDRATQLTEAKKLYDDRLISFEEYQQMRKDILDIEE